MGDLARVLQVSVPYISDVERGRRCPLGPDKITKIAEAFGISADRLHAAAAVSRGAFELDAASVTPKGREVGAALMRGWSHLTDEQLDEIARVLDRGKAK
jgi:transcriptional regulator with XRE-family HTH domain